MVARLYVDLFLGYVEVAMADYCPDLEPFRGLHTAALVPFWGMLASRFVFGV